jgi:branched-chain amino acid transport system permease protein
MLLAQSVVNGILLGGLYACMGMGFALAWGVMNVINLAHGSMILSGAFVTFWLTTRFGIDPILTLPFSAATLFLLGYVLQRYIINRIVSKQLYLTLILTFGIDMVLTNLNIALFTADVRSLTSWYTGLALEIEGVRIAYTRLIVFVLAVLLALSLRLFLNLSRTGRAIRATAQNAHAARVLGIDTKHIYAVTFGIGAATAGAVGSLFAVVYAFSPVIGALFTLKSFVIAILGGLGNPLGIVLSGVFLGVTENLVSSFGNPGYRDAISFGLLVLILVLRPTGLLGKQSYAVTRA